MSDDRPKRPRDINQLAKAVVDIATGNLDESPPERELTGAQKFAQSGGRKGGRARAAALSPERRREIAKVAAEKRWAARVTKGE